MLKTKQTLTQPKNAPRAKCNFCSFTVNNYWSKAYKKYIVALCRWFCSKVIFSDINGLLFAKRCVWIITNTIYRKKYWSCKSNKLLQKRCGKLKWQKNYTKRHWTPCKWLDSYTEKYEKIYAHNIHFLASQQYFIQTIENGVQILAQRPIRKVSYPFYEQ